MTIYAVYGTVEASEAAVEALKVAGFSEADISVLYTGNGGSASLDNQRIADERSAADVASGERVGPALLEFGFPDDLAKRYGRRILEDDAVLVSVRCSDGGWAQQAQAILEHAGGEDISATTGSPLARGGRQAA